MQNACENMSDAKQSFPRGVTKSKAKYEKSMQNACDSIGDAEALLKADVGLCMGSGCDVAKDNSDLIIDDNNFESIHKAIKWGRALFDNVRKFIMF